MEGVNEVENMSTQHTIETIGQNQLVQALLRGFEAILDTAFDKLTPKLDAMQENRFSPILKQHTIGTISQNQVVTNEASQTRHQPVTYTLDSCLQETVHTKKALNRYVFGSPTKELEAPETADLWLRTHLPLAANESFMIGKCKRFGRSEVVAESPEKIVFVCPEDKEFTQKAPIQANDDNVPILDPIRFVLDRFLVKRLITHWNSRGSRPRSARNRTRSHSTGGTRPNRERKNIWSSGPSQSHQSRTPSNAKARGCYLHGGTRSNLLTRGPGPPRPPNGQRDRMPSPSWM